MVSDQWPVFMFRWAESESPAKLSLQNFEWYCGLGRCRTGHWSL